MKNIPALLKKDFQRDLRNPTGLLVLLCIPLIMGVFMASIFGANNDTQKRIVIHLAILDRDDDFLSGMMRSMGSQGQSDQQLQVHLVETEEEGVQMLEDRKASAFLILPDNLTQDLINGATAAIQIYTNPAESILPRIVEQGTGLLATLLSETVRVFQPQLKEVSRMIHSESHLSSWEYTLVFYGAMQKAEALQDYLFPPLITFESMTADEFIAGVSTVRDATTEVVLSDG